MKIDVPAQGLNDKDIRAADIFMALKRNFPVGEDASFTLTDFLFHDPDDGISQLRI